MKKTRKNWVIIGAVVAALLAVTPFVVVARMRASMSTKPRLHVFFDMDSQPKFQAQEANPLFLDARAMRLPVENTLAVEEALDGPAATGMRGGEWLAAIPVPIDESLMRRGQERFGIYCAPCHGLSGYGDGLIAIRADELMQVEASSWVPPTNYHTDDMRQRPVGHIFNTITNGIRTMPPYRAQIAPHDRWAITAYARALQKSQNATIEDVPPAMRRTLP